MAPPLLTLLLCVAAAAAHLPIAAAQIAGPGDIVVSMYNDGQQTADTNITVYDSTGAFKYNIGNFNAPAGLAYMDGICSGCAHFDCC